MTTNLIARARGGDEEAFGQLVDPYQRELQVHCYRILGSVQDAEDVLQETLLSAWRSLGAFEERASIRTWLYRVATSRCLNWLRASRRRPPMDWPPPGVEPPEPTRMSEVVWLDPYPDVLLEGLADSAPGPDARYEALESISLAFVIALQLLPPRQRAALVLRDVLGFRAAEVADMLDTTEESVTSALKRARANLQGRLVSQRPAEPAPVPDSAAERELLARLTAAYESGDVAGIVGLFTEDVTLVMPPVPFEYQGRDTAARFFAAVPFRHARRVRLVATRSNGQPAYGLYLRDPVSAVARATGLMVLTLSGDRICAITHFDKSSLPRFGLPRTLPD